MERKDFRTILRQAVQSFRGFAPMGILAEVNESEYKDAVNPNSLDAVKLQALMPEMVSWYFLDIESNLEFTEYEHLWMLASIASNLNLVGKREMRLLSDLYLRSVANHTNSRIFCIMLLLNLDKLLPEKQSFMALIFNVIGGDKSSYSQRDVLLDLIDIMADLGSIRYQDKALFYIIKYASLNSLSYVHDRIRVLIEMYDEGIQQTMIQWIEKGSR